jgi:hypothetical protein
MQAHSQTLNLANLNVQILLKIWFFDNFLFLITQRKCSEHPQNPKQIYLIQMEVLESL